MKPGYQTSEFWAMCGVQITALVTALGTNDAASKVTSGMVALVAIGGYLYSRHALKSAAGASPPATPANSTPTVVAALLIAMLLLFAAPAWAQEKRDSALKPGDVFIPHENRPTNISGQCVWCASQSVWLTAGYEPFRGVARRSAHEGWNGATLDNLVAFCKATRTPITFERKAASPQILFDAIANGTACYIHIDNHAHAVALVGIDADGVRIVDNNPPLAVRAWSRATFDHRWSRTAAYPTINLRAPPEWKAIDGQQYLYRGKRLAGCFNLQTRAWWAWDGKAYAQAPPPWAK